METAEAKKWLRGNAGARTAHRWDAEKDEIISFFIPTLCGKDVALVGDPIEYAHEIDAIDAAQRFQHAIRRNHPEARTAAQRAYDNTIEATTAALAENEFWCVRCVAGNPVHGTIKKRMDEAVIAACDIAGKDWDELKEEGATLSRVTVAE